MIGVQAGLIGMALYLYLLGRQWWETRHLTGEEQLMARALVLTMAVGCLLNSFLLDHTEGHLYAYLTALLFAPLLRSESIHSRI
jgi:O-antigen ligase